ncbi:MAG TPA: DUF1207 domain-containing protein [Pirellulales bacterium]|nr:DUF1207 domain-containing protein [Pirellulales bacterium]
MFQSREVGPRAAVLLAAIFVAVQAVAAHAQEPYRLPDVSILARQPESIPPGASSSGAYPPVTLPPNASAVPSGPGLLPPGIGAAPPGVGAAPSGAAGLEESITLGNPTPLTGQPVRPPSQGEIGRAWGPSSELPWSWHFLPTGLMYRSYLAGVKEPRLGTAWLTDSSLGPYHDTRLNTPQVGTVWDSTLGARVGILRYGTPNAYRPEGFQIDLTGSAQPRLNPFGESTPLLSCDYTIGIPITYARGKWQYKTGYNHLSSHMGDELLINNPSLLSQRINYVRDSIMLGVGCYVTDNLRLFGEFDYAIGLGGGSEPVELQWGADYSPARPGGAPFFAVYGDQRQELKYGGFFVVQAGWQWRGGLALSTFRIGLQYINGKSSQWEFFNTFEQRVGWGIWYDF